jgi:hypothetical protein
MINFLQSQYTIKILDTFTEVNLYRIEKNWFTAREHGHWSEKTSEGTQLDTSSQPGKQYRLSFQNNLIIWAGPCPPSFWRD